MWGKVAMPSDTCADIYMFYRGSKGWFCMPDGFQGLFPVMLLLWTYQRWAFLVVHAGMKASSIAEKLHYHIMYFFYVQMIATFILVFLIKQPPKILSTQCGCMSFLWWDSYNSVIHWETWLKKKVQTYKSFLKLLMPTTNL